MSEQTIFVGVPTHDGRIDIGAGEALWATASLKHPTRCVVSSTSLLSMNCNILWCDALNRQASENIGWFAMLHSDIHPEAGWVDVLIEEAEKYGADLMGAVVPIKDSSGATSTAIDSLDDPWIPFCRLTQKQVLHPDFPDTFDIQSAAAALEGLPEALRYQDVPRSNLLINTGCFIVRMGRAWNESLHFSNSDTIQRDATGKFAAYVQPEDWKFSRMAAAAGAKVMATRRVRLNHRGVSAFPSTARWGVDRDRN